MSHLTSILFDIVSGLFIVEIHKIVKKKKKKKCFSSQNAAHFTVINCYDAACSVLFLIV